jgi:molybdopterin/thiamine biosynthesis adenylyltransferase
VRSRLAAQALAELGYTRVCSMRGGFAEWQRAGHAWIVPAGDGDGDGDGDGQSAPLSVEQATRYARHLRLPEIGVAGQRRLLAARVLCVGAGGLGSPASLYLAAAGVGTLGIVDADVVELSNLQRQVVHASDRVGMPKVDSAAQTLRALNPDVRVTRIAERLVAANALAILADYDVIVDGSDNFPTRYLVNDAALRLRKPVIHAAIQRFEGQLTMFAADGAPCYRCLFPRPPPAEAAPSCAEAGVLGVLPGVLGVLQATEAIKQVLGIGASLVGRLVTYNALSMSFTELRLRRDPACPTCGEGVDRSAIEPRPG